MATTPSSLEDAKVMVQSLRNDPDNVDLHQRLRDGCTEESWPYLCEAGYVDFLSEHARSYEHDETRSVSFPLTRAGAVDSRLTTNGPWQNGLPAWYLSAWAFALALQASNSSPPQFRVNTLNIKALSQMRKSIASQLSPTILNSKKNLIPSDSNPDVQQCIAAATAVYFALCHSLKIHPDESHME